MNLDTWEKRVHRLVLRVPVLVSPNFGVPVHRDPKIRIAKQLENGLGSVDSILG